MLLPTTSPEFETIDVLRSVLATSPLRLVILGAVLSTAVAGCPGELEAADCIEYRDYIHTVARLDLEGRMDDVAIEGDLLIAGCHNGIRICDVSDPVQPFLIGSLDIPQCWGISTEGGTAFAIAGDDVFRVIDYTVPNSPTVVGQLVLSEGASGIDSSWPYAYVTTGGHSLVVIDASDPESPVVVGAVGTGTYPGPVLVQDGQAFVLSSLGLQIFDIGQPTQPELVGEFPSGEYNRDVAVAGTVAYLGVDDRALHLIDIGDPAMPQLISSVEVPWHIWHVAVFGDQAYVTSENHLQIVDVSNPNDVVLLGTHGMSGNRVVVDGDYLFGSTGWNLEVVDVSNPVISADIDVLSTPGSASCVTVRGDRAYLGDGVNGMHVLDISDPEEPVLLGTADTPFLPNRIILSGSYAYVADGNAGVHIADITDPFNPTFVGEARTGDVRDLDIKGDTMYTVNYHHGHGLRVVDISDVSNPTIETSIPLTGHGASVEVFGNHLALGAYAFEVWNIDEPRSPVMVGTIPTPGLPQDIFIQQGFAYVADLSGGLLIIDLSDPSFPEIISQIPTQDHAESVVVRDGIAYVATSATGTIVIDVRDKWFPEILGSLPHPNYATGVAVTEEVLYVAGDDLQIGALQCAQPTASIPGVDVETHSPGTAISTPNPFAQQTQIHFNLPSREIRLVEIFDMQGRLVARPAVDSMGAGGAVARWDGRDELGRHREVGVYLYRAATPSGTIEGKLMLMR